MAEAASARPDARLRGVGPLSGLPMDQARVHNKEKPTDVSPAGLNIKEGSAAALHKPHAFIMQKV
jgi:hypothetical protein